MIGYIMSEGAKANIGSYATSTSGMLAAMDAGTATYNTSLTTTYTSGGGGIGGSAPASNLGYSTVAPTPSSSVSVDLSAGPSTQLAVAANAGFTVTASNGVNALTLNLTDSSGTSDVVNLAIVSATTTGLTVGRITAAGVETLNVSSGGSLSGGGAGNALNLDPVLDVFRTVAIYGAQPIYVDTGAYGVSVTLNGGGATGELQLRADSVTNVAVGSTMAGGIKNDTLWPVTLAGAGGINQSLYGGGGGDLFNLGAAHTESNILVYKSANDSQYDVTGTAGASGTSTPNTGRMDTVNNFVSGRDKVDISAFGLSSGQAQVVTRTAADTTALATLAATPTFYQDVFSIARGVVAARVAADTFLYIDTNKNGFFDSGADLVIKLVGLAAFTSVDIIK